MLIQALLIGFCTILTTTCADPYSNESAAQILNRQEGCHNDGEQVNEVDVGWPAIVSCHHDNFDYYDESGNKIYCRITSLENREILFNATLDLDQVDDTVQRLGDVINTMRFEVITKVIGYDSCFKKTVVVQARRFVPPRSCREIISDDKPTRRVLTLQFKKKRHNMAELAPALTPYEKNVFREYNINPSWTRNCSDLPPGATLQVDKIHIGRAEFSHAGVYVAMVKYKNMSKVISRTDLCVEEKTQTSDPSVTCEKRLYRASITSWDASKAGDVSSGRVHVACSIQLGYGSVNDFHFSTLFMKIKLKREPVLVCVNNFDGVSNVTGDLSGTCVRTTDNGKNKCYMYDPPKEEWERSASYLHTNLTLNIRSKSDYGTYVLRYNSPRNGPKRNFTFEVAPSRRDAVNAVAIGASAGAILFMIGCCALLLHFRLHLAVYFKRNFGPYKSDEGYDYDAFVSYHVSAKIDEAERAVLREMVEKTRHVMDELGYKRIYDLADPRSFEPGENRETLVYNKINKSHRVFIFIPSNSYFNDESCQHIMQLSLKSTLESRSKVVIVIDKSLIRDVLKSTNEEKISLAKSMKEGYVIKWPSTSKSFLRISLANAMSVYSKKKHVKLNAQETDPTRV